MRFAVTIRAVWAKAVEVEAESAAAAEKKALEDYNAEFSGAGKWDGIAYDAGAAKENVTTHAVVSHE